MSKDLIILCASADGTNIAEIIEKLPEWNLIGFLDDAPIKQNTVINDIPVLGKIEDVSLYPKCHFILLAGNPKNYFIKKKLFDKLDISLNRFVTIIHPSAYISRFASIGKNVAIFPNVTVMANATIGNHVFIASKCNIGHGSKIGDYVLMSALVAIPGNVIVEEGCWIGLNASIRDGITIGKWSLVGMGSVVIKDVEPYTIVAGNPAKVIGVVEPSA